MAETTTRDEHQLLIGGKWVDAAEGTYEIVNPATEELVGRAPNASAEDALTAAAAAKDAQPGWAAWSAEERGALMREAAAAIRAKSSELLPLVIAETGATATVGSRMQVPVAADRFERYAPRPAPGAADAAAPPTGPGDAVGAGRDHRRHGQPPAARRGRLHHVVQLPDGQHGREGGPGAGGRQHGGREAGAAGPARHRGAGSHPQRRRLPTGRGEPGQRKRSGLLRSVGGCRRGRLRQLHGLDAGGRHHRREGGADDEAHAAGVGREGRMCGVRGCGHQGRDRLHRVDVVVPLGPDLHRADAGGRASQRVRPGA